ncbi:MAG: hypothetical protein ACK4JY_08805 [Brevundimonas sp.]|uniref:hypothetical protein n=1 Tax=Brevundimonas sp. TaxID=1871086 RepID=UPI0039193EA2
MNTAQVITNIATDLKATEQSLDAAIAQATALVQTMINARNELNISAVVGADSQAKALEAIASLSAARQAMVACHEELAKDHRRMGYGVYAGAFDDKGQGRAPEQRLRAV